MARLKSLEPRLSRAPERKLQEINPNSWRSGKTTAQRGYGYRWQKERERYLMANPLCVYCQDQGSVTAASVVDHKTPHRGDQALFWDRANWQSLCAACHSSVKQAEEKGGGEGDR